MFSEATHLFTHNLNKVHQSIQLDTENSIPEQDEFDWETNNKENRKLILRKQKNSLKVVKNLEYSGIITMNSYLRKLLKAIAGGNYSMAVNESSE